LKDKEVDEKSNVQKMHIANFDKPVNFLASLALLVATSLPEQKDIIIKLIMNMIYDGEKT